MGGLLHFVQRGWAWAAWGPAKAHPRCTKCNSPPINGQCTNFIIILFDVALQLPQAFKGLTQFWKLYFNFPNLKFIIMLAAMVAGKLLFIGLVVVCVDELCLFVNKITGNR